MTLWSEFLTHTGRVAHKWEHYLPVYERHFSRFVNQDVVMLEIGAGAGGSAQLWKQFLGPHARIVSIDIRPDCAAFEERQISVRIGDQNDPAFLRGIVEEFGTPDIVLDDGSHVMEHIHTSFRTLYPLLSRTGVYAVEDLHTAYWPDYQGGLKRDGSFMETCKGLIDELNAGWSGESLQPTPFSESTLSMHFYPSVVVFERGRHQPFHDLRTGGRPAKPDPRLKRRSGRILQERERQE